MNADVAAYDIRPLPVRIKHNRVLQTTGGTKDDQSECNVFHPLSEAWTPVLKGGPEQLLLPEHANRTLLLIWPPNENEMAHDALNAYQGRYVIYIGETLGHTADPCFPFGQTGSESFHRLLHSKFHRVSWISSPAWYELLNLFTDTVWTIAELSRLSRQAGNLPTYTTRRHWWKLVPRLHETRRKLSLDHRSEVTYRLPSFDRLMTVVRESPKCSFLVEVRLQFEFCPWTVWQSIIFIH